MNLTEIIQSYVNGTLPEMERERFESQLSKSPDLLARVEKERMVQNMLDDTGMEELRASMKKIAEEE